MYDYLELRSPSATSWNYGVCVRNILLIQSPSVSFCRCGLQSMHVQYNLPWKRCSRKRNSTIRRCIDLRHRMTAATLENCSSGGTALREY